MTTPSQKQWYKYANHLKNKVNLAWVFEKLNAPLVICSLLLTCSLIAVRNYSPSYETWWGLVSVFTICSLCLCYAFFKAKVHFESKSDALIRLETKLNLNSTLSAAEAGASSWPKVPQNVQTSLSWNYTRISLPIVSSLLLLTAAILIPVSYTAPPAPIAAPKSWGTMLAELNELEKKGIIQPEYIEEMAKKIKELQSQPQPDWYKHASLEAGNNLKQLHQLELDKLTNHLDTSERTLETLMERFNDLSSAEKDAIEKQLHQAIEAMQNGQMKPNKQLLEKLKQAHGDHSKQLTPEQAQQLRENLKNLSDTLRKQLRDGIDPGKELAENGEGAQRGQFDPNQEGKPQEQKGETNRQLGTEAEPLEIDRNEGLSSKDLKNAIPGDLLDTTDDDQHEVDRSATAQQEGGTAKNTGKGGDAIWKGNYLPEEKRALKNFFK